MKLRFVSIERLCVCVTFSFALWGASGCRSVPSASVLKIQVPAEDLDADVFVDGEYIGQIDQVSGKLRLAPGAHRVELRKNGRFPVQKTIEVDRKRPQAETTIDAELLADPR